MRGTVLLLAAGRGERFGSAPRAPKAFTELEGRTLLGRSADAAASTTLVDALVVAVPAGLERRAHAELGGVGVPWRVVAGGATRQESARLALEACGGADAVGVHDAARALCLPALFDACLRALDRFEAVCPGVPLVDTVKQVRDGVAVSTPDRSAMVRVQTPQAFRADVYRRAHAAAATDGVEATDDAALVERIGVAVHVLPGDEDNLKITTTTDLEVARLVLERRRAARP